MISELTLRNIDIKDLKQFSSDKKIPGRDKEIKSANTILKYKNYQSLFEKELEKNERVISEKDVDEFLFNQLYYVRHNCHYFYKFSDANKLAEMDEATFIDYVNQNHIVQLNQSLVDWDETNTNKIDLCTMRYELNLTGTVKIIHVLFRIGTVIDKTLGSQNFFAGICINLETKSMVIKFDGNQMKASKQKPMMLVGQVINAIHGDRLNFLGINIQDLNNEDALKTIYNLFADLSIEAEELLDQEMQSNTEQKIHDFLKDLNVSQAKEDYEEYVEQVKAVVYQDISKKIDSENFDKGWVFRFRFREGDHSKASSNSDRRQAVYSCKAFWQLKELIHSVSELEEAGLHWRMDLTNFVDARIESKNGTMIIYYYLKTREMRKEKEEYVLQKISQYI